MSQSDEEDPSWDGWLPEIITVPAGSQLTHTSGCRFAGGRKYPYYIYNWYGIGKTPFWESGILYLYDVKKDIPDILYVDKKAPDEEPELLFKHIWDDFQLTGEDDYASSAFACQVLGMNGILYSDSMLVLCGNGSKWLKLSKVLKVENLPRVGPRGVPFEEGEFEQVPECDDKSGQPLPVQDDWGTFSMDHSTGINYYDPIFADKVRLKVSETIQQLRKQADALASLLPRDDPMTLKMANLELGDDEEKTTRPKLSSYRR